jgi:YVTN family beta-propeller protein
VGGFSRDDQSSVVSLGEGAMRDKVAVALAVLLTVPMILVPSPALAADPSLGPTITVGSGPTGIAIAPDGATAYVANYNDNTVSVIRLSDNSVTSINVGSTPTSVAIWSSPLRADS